MLKIPEEERRTIFRNAAQKMRVHEAIVEKDYWVCLVLDYLFHKSDYREHLSFKGGTSLSKCYGLIKRFSEDIDLVLDWRLLGYGKDEPWLERSKTKQEQFNKDVGEKTMLFLVEEFVPAITSDISDIIGKKAEINLHPLIPQAVCVNYPPLCDTSVITQSIQLEIGALAAWTPVVKKTIKPYIFDCYPQLEQTVTTTVITSSAARTFWEKVTILHHEANRPKHLEMPARYSRHYYDLFRIGQSAYKEEAFSQPELLDKVARFKMRFYPRGWAEYDKAVPGTIKLMPPSFRYEALRGDYERMKEMLFGYYPSFDELMKAISELEAEMNSI